jgi:hypothetical protein
MKCTLQYDLETSRPAAGRGRENERFYLTVDEKLVNEIQRFENHLVGGARR